MQNADGTHTFELNEEVEVDGKRCRIVSIMDHDAMGQPCEYMVEYDNGKRRAHMHDTLVEGDSSYDYID